MSSKSTIILSKDNEHWYDDCNESRYKNGKFIGNDITIEINKSNIVDRIENSDGICIVIKGDCDLAKQLHRLKYNPAIEVGTNPDDKGYRVTIGGRTRDGKEFEL